MGGLSVQAAELCQRGIIRGEHAGKVLNVLPCFFGKAHAAAAQVIGHGAHLGSAAAGKQERPAAFQQSAGQIVTVLGT